MSQKNTGLIREEYDPKKLEVTTTGTIYKSRAGDIIPPPKVELKYPGVDFVSLVYPRLGYSVLESEPRDILFCLVHNIQPTRQRLYDQGRTQDAACPLPECQGRSHDIEHIFTSCTLVNQAWLWLRTRLLRLLPETVGARGISSIEFLLLQFPKDSMDKEVVWLLGNYCDVVVKVVLGKKKKLTAERAATIVRSRLLLLQTRAVVIPQIFNL